MQPDLGLSQAHQIRGRVGRSETKSFAYFLYNPKNLTPLVKDRLKALEDAQELGAGYRIAIKDLELRGAGNILRQRTIWSHKQNWIKFIFPNSIGSRRKNAIKPKNCKFTYKSDIDEQNIIIKKYKK